MKNTTSRRFSRGLGRSLKKRLDVVFLCFALVLSYVVVFMTGCTFSFSMEFLFWVTELALPTITGEQANCDFFREFSKVRRKTFEVFGNALTC